MNTKTISKRIVLALAFGFFASQATAQEIQTYFRTSSEPAPVQRGVAEARFLPFFADFSQSTLYPDSTKWTDNNVLVNDGFPFCPPNRNAATFDVEKDYVLFKAKGEPWTLTPGEFAIFFPEEGAHAPCLSADGPRRIRKLVVKVRK